MRNTRKLLVALVLVMTILMTMAAAVIPASAANISGGTKLYLVPSANWNQSNARFAAYFFGDGEAWVSMTKVAGESNLYEVTSPAGKNFTNVIFCRMNPNASANNWNNKWNQTSDLTYNGSSNCYTVKEGTWDKGGGTWSSYGNSCAHANVGPAATCTTDQVCTDCGDPVVSALGHTYNSAHLCTRCNEQATFTVAGSGAHLGTEWDTGNTANDMTYADGVYTKVYTNVAAGSYLLKVARDHDWGTAYPDADKAYTVATAGSTVTVTLKGTTVTITVEAPHVHNFVEGKCECGEEDPNYVPPHEHNFVDGKCECGAEDPNYVPPHVNALVVGQSNKIVIDETAYPAVVEGNTYYNAVVAFTPDATGTYTFISEEGKCLCTIYLSATEAAFGQATLEAGTTYYVWIGFYTPETYGEDYITVTYTAPTNPDGGDTPAHVNALVVSDTNKIVITEATPKNAYGFYFEMIPFAPEEAGNYSFVGEGVTCWIYSGETCISMTGAANLEAGNYYIAVATATTGEFNVAVTMSEIVDTPVEPPVEVELPKLVLGDNTVVIDGTVTNLTGNAIAWLEFVVTEAGSYKVSSSDLNCYIYSEMNLASAEACLCGWTGAAQLEPGTYYVCVGKDGKTGEFTVKAEAVGEVAATNTIVVGANTYVLNAPRQALGYEWMYLTVEKDGTYAFSGLSPLTFFIWPDYPNQATVDANAAYVWNVDNVTYDLLDGFTVDLVAGTYLIGVRFDGDAETVAVGEYNYSITAVEPQPEQPEVELNLFQQIMKAITDFFAQLVAWFENIFAGLKN